MPFSGRFGAMTSFFLCHNITVLCCAGQQIATPTMALSKAAMVALIVALATLIPAASAWQEQMRDITRARMYITGAMALATFPSANVRQFQDPTMSSLSDKNATKPRDTYDWGPSCFTRQACLVQLAFQISFLLSALSTLASYVSLTLPEEVAGTSLINHWSYKMIRFVAIYGFFFAFTFTNMAAVFAMFMNPFGGDWPHVVLLGFMGVMFILVIIVWVKSGTPSQDNVLPS